MEQGLDREGRVVDGQGGEDGVEPARLQGVEENVGHAFAKVQLQPRKATLERSEEMGHEVGSQGRDHSQAEVAGQRLPSAAGGVQEPPDVLQDGSGQGRHLLADRGHEDAPPGALEELDGQ